MPGRDLPARSQANTRALGFGRVEGHEQILRVDDPGTVIDDLEFTLALMQPAAQANGGSPDGIGLQRVLYQVDQRLLEVHRIAEYFTVRKGSHLERLARKETLELAGELRNGEQ